MDPASFKIVSHPRDVVLILMRADRYARKTWCRFTAFLDVVGKPVPSADADIHGFG